MMSVWLNMAVIALGGAVGAVCRYLITVAAVAVPGGSTMWGTTIANLLGCAAIGALSEYSLLDESMSDRALLAVRVGFLGSLTTFSTFAAESTALVAEDRLGAGIYVGANLLLGWTCLLVSAAIVKGWMT